MMTLKRCNSCKVEKSVDDFHNDKCVLDGKARQCKVCAHLRSVARTSLQNRGYNLKKYGITLDDYQQMFDAQGGKCAICGTMCPGSKELHFHIDHDHLTGLIRGLLCERCNVGLGYYRTPEILEKAAIYLRSFPANGQNKEASCGCSVNMIALSRGNV